MENRALKKELAKLESREKYEEKYLQAEKQIEQLKKELETVKFLQLWLHSQQ